VKTITDKNNRSKNRIQVDSGNDPMPKAMQQWLDDATGNANEANRVVGLYGATIYTYYAHNYVLPKLKAETEQPKAPAPNLEKERARALAIAIAIFSRSTIECCTVIISVPIFRFLLFIVFRFGYFFNIVYKLQGSL
jgi:hypothetical protein